MTMMIPDVNGVAMAMERHLVVTAEPETVTIVSLVLHVVELHLVANAATVATAAMLVVASSRVAGVPVHPRANVMLPEKHHARMASSLCVAERERMYSNDRTIKPDKT
jgi:hypothetical protein